MVQIACVNESTDLSDADLASYATAYQIQVTRDFAPKHGLLDATVTAYPKGAKPPANAWVLAFLDDSDQADALGYHDVTPTGLPLGKVFVKTTLSVGDSVSVTGSHELLEMLGDPEIIQTANIDGNATFYMFEMCDACEDDSFGYDINGVLVSDFVLMDWFVTESSGPYDFQGKITKPLEILPGGYIGEFVNGSWTQLTNGKSTGRAVVRPGSRRERRLRGRQNWKRSTY